MSGLVIRRGILVRRRRKNAETSELKLLIRLDSVHCFLPADAVILATHTPSGEGANEVDYFYPGPYAL